MVRHGYPVVNLDVAEQIADAALEYLDGQSRAVTREVMGRLISCVLLLLASAAGILTGLFGVFSLFGKISGATAVLCCVSGFSAIAGLAAGLVTGGFRGFAFGLPTSDKCWWGHVVGKIPGSQHLRSAHQRQVLVGPRRR